MAKYYAITTSMKFEKLVLVPIDSVKDIEEAMEIVDKAVETSDIALFDEEDALSKVDGYSVQDDTELCK